jgi:hypothetical protein
VAASSTGVICDERPNAEDRRDSMADDAPEVLIRDRPVWLLR